MSIQAPGNAGWCDVCEAGEHFFIDFQTHEWSRARQLAEWSQVLAHGHSVDIEVKTRFFI